MLRPKTSPSSLKICAPASRLLNTNTTPTIDTHNHRGQLVTTANNQKPDVAAILSDLREQIRERRARLTVDGAADPHAHALNLAELRRSVESVNDTWFVSAHLPITWE